MVQPPSRKEIWKMFDQISSTYDKANRVMSYGIDCYWRKKMTSFFPKGREVRILDLATGTADQIIFLMESRLQISEAVGIDLAKEMLEIGKRKLADKAYVGKVSLLEASALEIPFEEASFDYVTMSFGIRNVTDVEGCLKEIHRVLKPGGQTLILEGTVPTNVCIRPLYLFYLRHLLPRIAGWISKNRDAYVYLNETIETFPSGESFCELMSQAGFQESKPHPLTGGIVTIYQGAKACKN